MSEQKENTKIVATVNIEGQNVNMYAKDVAFGAGKIMSAQGQMYRIKKMPFEYTVTNEFWNDKIFVPMGEITEQDMQTQRFYFSNDNDGSAERPSGKQYRENIDKWLNRLVFKNNGEPMNIEKCVLDGWSDEDFNRCIQVMAGSLG